jgi:F420-dependent oxidoreductase-like protein
VRLGVHLGAWARGYGAPEQLRLAQAAETLGYDSVWVSENYGSDGVAVLAWLAAATDRIRLGSAILQIPARTPALTAMAAATLDHLSGGRFVLGLGLSGPQVVEGWHGQPSDRPVRRLREYVDVVRLALARERVAYDGELYPLPRPGGEGKPLKLIVGPVQERIPVYLGVFGPRATALAAEIADGWIPFFFCPERADIFRAQLEAGAARSGRSLAELDVAPLVEASVGEDAEACRAALRPVVATYVGGAGSRKTNFYADLVRRYGFGEVADRLQDLYLSGRREEAIAAVPDELLEAITLCGSSDRVRARLDAYRDAGVGTLIVSPVGAGVEERLATMAALAS